jgi:selenide,water dikinase
VLRPLQDIFPREAYPDLLVGLGAPDDAAVWKLEGGQGLVVTTDFFTPVVDDPYTYGAVAAANALSDLYAMGAQPMLALNIAAMPADLPFEIVQEIFRGGAEKVLQAGAVIAGGHSIQDREPKYGLVAVGLVPLDRLMSKAGARLGDVLALTKPLGTGVITTALKLGKARPSDVDEAVRWMLTLNRDASRIGAQHGVRGATDVTGFGLLGHLIEMTQASQVGVELAANAIPLLPGAIEYARQGVFPGGTTSNYEYYRVHVTCDNTLELAQQMLLYDAQTSGGLLLSVPGNAWDRLAGDFEADKIPLWPIGRFNEGEHVVVRNCSYAELGE